MAHLKNDKEGKVRNCYLPCNFKESCNGEYKCFVQINKHFLNIQFVTRIMACNVQYKMTITTICPYKADYAVGKEQVKIHSCQSGEKVQTTVGIQLKGIKMKKSTKPQGIKGI